MPCKTFKYFLFIIVLFISSINYSSNNSPEGVENDKHQNLVKEFEKWDLKNSFPKDAVLFTGDSNISLWDTRPAFIDFPVINRGLKGAETSDIIHYHQRIINPYKPAVIILSAGCCDIKSGKTPLQVMNDINSLCKLLLAELPDARIIILSIHPGPAGQRYSNSCMQTNKYYREISSYDTQITYIDVSDCLLNSDNLPDKDLYMKDMIHLNDKGYKKWISIVTPVLKDIYSRHAKEQNTDMPAEIITSSLIYIASKNSKVFHRNDCSSVKRIAEKNIIRFANRQQALDSGRRPCKTCKP